MRAEAILLVILVIVLLGSLIIVYYDGYMMELGRKPCARRRDNKDLFTYRGRDEDLYAYYLTLPDRTEKQRHIEEGLKRNRIAFERFLPNDTEEDSHHVRVHKSHIQMLRKGQMQKHKSILILEDDVDLSNVSNLHETILKFARDWGEWDVVNLGSNGNEHLKEHIIENKMDSFRASRSQAGCQGYVVKRQSIDRLVSIFGKDKPIGWACIENIEWPEDFIVITANPSIVCQNTPGKDDGRCGVRV